MKTFKELREDLKPYDELDEGIVSKTLTGLVDKGLHKVLDKLEKMTGKHLGFVQKSNIPSAGKDKANTAFHWSADALVTGEKLKKEAEDFHRKAKKQWTWSKKEVGDSFRYYGDDGKIPPEQREAVSDLQAEMQRIIDMHTQLEKMMQTTGNSAKYQRTMEKLEFDTNRVFEEIGKVTERGDARYRAAQGIANLKKAKKMTHKTKGQKSPAKFRAYGNRGESFELDEGIVSKTLTGLVDKGLHKVLDQIEKKTGKHLGFVKKSTVPSAGKDRGNEFVKFKKEAEDFHRKAKKQWTWSSKEIESGFQYYGYGKIPDDKVKFVKRVQADIQKIIAMHTKLESMMQTTGNSPTYQRTMEKLESDTKRVFKEIDDGGIGAIGGKYRAMQGMDNLKKAKKMTHKEPRQTSPAKFRAYANMGEEKSFSEFKNELEK